MPIELECKVRVPSLVPIRGRLQSAGASWVGRVLETNRLFDRRDDSLREAGCGLRVRSVEVLDGRGPAATLTYKGPRTPSLFKRREEIEVDIGDTEAMTEVLHALGYAEKIIFEKRRESWLLDPCHVELDELPKLGTFVEVEGPDERAIQDVLSSTGLAEAEHVSEGYAAMTAALGGDGARPVIVRFEQEVSH